ncbi:formylglycine-generating enzyme family protein [Polyangium aurulentum]|uniref:formylglycine-generating enzyme family protein n=1 Tax=Polyangium aurulentum TaxID=2567896 RepID=UPI0010AEDB56|nr:SUMF1/EgtB/PvdO family nonheme iron enzyme [Polyangium aurulentum]UQA54559.1 formylglycine-generating enzyme family protein [Polyangium aurulentum]
MNGHRWIVMGALLAWAPGCGASSESGGAAREPAPVPEKTAAQDPPPAKPEPEPAQTAAPTPSAEAKAEPPPAPKSPCPANMAFIKGGAYKMGFLKNEATVGDFCLDTTEVTAKDYAACVDAKKCNENFVNCAPESTYKKEGKEDHPMVCVDFQQAIDYCAAQGKRLPTDEEWEWAARGGPEGRLFPWGNDEPKDQLCWSGKGARKGTCSVKEHPGGASAQGLLGLAGNVFEWTTNRLDSRGKDRVGRGGSWRDGLPNMMRNDRPGKFEVTYRCGFLGIRCAAAPSAEGAK